MKPVVFLPFFNAVYSFLLNQFVPQPLRVSALCLGMLLGLGMLRAQQVEVTISGIRSAKGQIMLGIYTNSKDFDEEKNMILKKISKSGIANNELKITVTLGPGTYGFTILDDENGNGKMEYNFVGMPEEGFGFSNYFHTGFSRPKFESFRFTLNSNQTQAVRIKVRYL